MALLDSPVLVLNRVWQPVNICTARRAICLLCVDHAHVVDGETYQTFGLQEWEDHSRTAPEEEVIHGTNTALSAPKVIVLTEYDRLPRRDVKFNRENVFRRDRYTCQYCRNEFDRSQLNIDHVIPRDKGGATSWENVVCSCIACNTKKGNKLPKEAKMIPLRTPEAPRWRPLFSSVPLENRDYDESWQNFLVR